MLTLIMAFIKRFLIKDLKDTEEFLILTVVLDFVLGILAVGVFYELYR